MKLCVDCKHCKRPFDGCPDDMLWESGLCFYPKDTIIEPGVSLVDGKNHSGTYAPIKERCHFVRRDENLCGTNTKWFEQRPAKSFWDKNLLEKK